MPIVPAIYEKANGSTLSYDIFSKLLKDRIIFAGGQGGAIDTDDANMLIAQLLYLESEDDSKQINLYVNSPGGSVTAGLAIYDTMMNLKCPVATVVCGMAMSFGAVLLAAGTPGLRYALPHSRIMIHQPLIMGGGISGQATDIAIEAREMEKHKRELSEIIAFHSGQTLEKVLADCERNHYMSAEEAKSYGIVDKVIAPTRGRLIGKDADSYWDAQK